MAPPGSSLGQVGSDYVVYIGEFLLGVGLDHDKFQVGAVGASVQVGQFNQEFLAEVLDYFSFYLRLGGGGQAEYRRRWAVARGLLDELADVAVIGPEVVAPLGEAMGFIQYPGAYFSLPDGAAY